MIQIIPAIDIIEGKCVRLEKGDYNKKKIYSEDPLETAKIFESWGIKRLHLVDLDGAMAKKIVNDKVLNRIASGTNLIIDFGGGLRTDNDIRIAFENGASMITGGSIAIHEPDLFLRWLDSFGNEKVILGADHNNEKISINAWSEVCQTDLFPFLEDYIQKGVKKIICTDIQMDGMLEGPSIDLYKRILSTWPEILLIASGGVSNPEDVYQLDKAGIKDVIIGKAFYENRITREDVKHFLNYF